jgi:hypothetical protein
MRSVAIWVDSIGDMIERSDKPIDKSENILLKPKI